MALSYDLLTDFAGRYVEKEDLPAFLSSCKRYATISREKSFWKCRYMKDICSSDENITDFEGVYKRIMDSFRKCVPQDQGYFCLIYGYDRLAEHMKFTSEQLLTMPSTRYIKEFGDTGRPRLVLLYIDIQIWTKGTSRIVQKSRPISLPPVIFDRMKHLLSGCQVVLYHGYYYLPFTCKYRYIGMKPFEMKFLPSLSSRDRSHENIPGATYFQF